MGGPTVGPPPAWSPPGLHLVYTWSTPDLQFGFPQQLLTITTITITFDRHPHIIIIISSSSILIIITINQMSNTYYKLDS